MFEFIVMVAVLQFLVYAGVAVGIFLVSKWLSETSN